MSQHTSRGTVSTVRLLEHIHENSYFLGAAAAERLKPGYSLK